jgi:hypothetical protein
MIKLKDILNEKGNRVERYSIFKEVKNQVTVVIAYPDKKGKYTEHDFMEGEGWD